MRIYVSSVRKGRFKWLGHILYSFKKLYLIRKTHYHLIVHNKSQNCVMATKFQLRCCIANTVSLSISADSDYDIYDVV